MCKFNGIIKKEAKRLGIEHRLCELEIEWDKRYKRDPKDLVDLLHGAVGA